MDKDFSFSQEVAFGVRAFLIASPILSFAAVALLLFDQRVAALAGGVLAGSCCLIALLLGGARERENALRERALKEEASDAEDIFAAIPSGLIGLDSDGVIRRWNGGASRILGVGRGGVLGRHVRDWPANGQAELVTLLVNALDGRTINRGSVEVVRNDGSKIPLGISTSRLGRSGESKAGVVAIFQDLTEVKKIQAEMKKHERLAAIGTLAASIAHEIRNPLASIAGSVEVLESELELGGDLGELLDLIIKESDRLNRLITDFLDFSREQLPLFGEFDPEGLAGEVLQAIRLRPEAGDELDLQLDAGNSPQRITGDRDMLKQAFLNLAINACQSMEWCGTLRVSIDEGRSGERKMLGFRFKDSGPGVPEESAQRLFEPFFTTRPKGTGLGLAIAHRFAEIHDGTLELVSGREGGAEFLFSLPFKSAEEVTAGNGRTAVLIETSI